LDMDNKTCLITGASSGIGEVTALELARRGARVILVCRDKAKGELVLSKISQETNDTKAELLLCDLSSQSQIRNLVEEFKRSHNRLDVLINNAAIVPRRRTLTADGIETQFAVNHLAYFLLTHLLLDMLKKSAPSRILLVSSGMHRTASLDFENLQGEKSYKAMKMYAKTKLCNILFTYELARRLEGSGVTANCLTPGFTATNLGRDFTPLSRWVMKRMAKDVGQGAETSIYLASSSDLEKVSGVYYDKMREIKSSPLTYDRELSRRLWEISLDMTNLTEE
jgi:NAD(P)-dependent dehydrogenase (short-subunit alcohol dehydrogenase family)